LGRFALIDALAQSAPPADYKALVCVFLFGGNDANNVVIPYTNYFERGGYNDIRGSATFAVPQADLLQINPPSTPGLTFGLHPRLGDFYTASDGTTDPSLKALWDQGNVAIVCNTGPLVRPFPSRNDYLQGLVPKPYQLFSHSDQQNLWQTSYATGPKQTGWGGSTVDRTGGSGTSFPAITSMAGVTVFSTGLNTRPLVLSPAPTPLNATLRLFNPATHINDPNDALMEALASDNGPDPMSALINGAANITDKALKASLSLQDNPMLSTPFPASSLGNQLLQVAKLISLASTLGVRRQVFFASLGGFDTHTGQGAFNGNAGQPALLSQLSQAIGAFYKAMVELGAANDVTLFTSSDFSRTFVPGGGGSGTDHAWGSHQFVVGGAVNGTTGVSNFYGQYPPLVVGDQRDTDSGGNARGRWIPTTAVDQYAATLANWYGPLSAGDQALVFPNLGNFSTSNLGFMG
jgi:uncharacterized protein (DUF1501 family)